MMNTDELIAALALDTKPVRSGQAVFGLVTALTAGAAVAMVLIAIFIGDPLLGTRSVSVMTFGVKMAFTASLLLLSGYLLYQAGRPGHEPGRGLPWIAAPFVLVATLAAIALASAPAGATHALIFGSSWQVCLLSVSLLSVPVYAMLVMAFRRLAPTDLKLTGLLAGLASGAMAALVYALHCPETSPAFLLIWYGLGIIAAGFSGRIAGPLLLRW
jgi:hypothetical protein